MKFVSVDIENFMAIGSASLNLDARGLLLIQGDNQDDTSQNSNGAGKSSIVDSLCWALFGKTAREETGDSVVNRKAGKNCRVTVNIIDDGIEYQIVRHRKYTKKKNVVELFKDGKDITSGTDKLTQEAIEQVLGCSYDVFRSSVYAGQDSQIDLPKMTDKFLKQVVEEAAGIDRLQALHDKAKSYANDAKAKVAVIEHELFGHQMTVDESELHLENAQTEFDKYEETRKDDIHEAEFLAKQAKTKVGKIVAELKAVDKAALEAEYDEIINRGVSKEWTDERAALSGEVMTLSNLQSTKQNQYDNLKSALQKYKKTIEESESLVGKPCGECGKAYCESDIDGVVSSMKKNIAKELPDAKALKVEIESVGNALSDAQTKLKAHEASATLTDEVKARRDALKAQIDDYQVKLTEAKSLKKDIERYETSVETIKAKANPHQSTLDSVKKRASEAQAFIDAADEKRAEADKNLAIANGVVEVYSNTGVRAHILDTVTPYLNARTSEYLTQLSDGNLSAVWNTLSTTAKGELREKFNIEVESATGGDRYGLLSGGEKRKVRLATNMALQDLVSSRATKPIDLYIGDEIDHALDVSGLERLMHLLEERARTHGTVLVVSHNELSDWIRESITVVKKDGYTTFTDIGGVAS